MKNRINELARGTFNEEVAAIHFSENEIKMQLNAADSYNGELRIYSEDDRKIRGIVYSDNVYVNVMNPEFGNEDNLIGYKVDTLGTVVGEEISGKFYVVSDAGEYVIPYTFTVGTSYVPSEIGELKNLFHFTNYVQSDYEKALALFKSPRFSDIFLEGDMELQALYRSLVRGQDARVGLEEFLVAIHKKARIILTVEGRSVTFADVSEVIEGKVLVRKDTWGYVQIKARSDSEFIILPNMEFDTDSFKDNVCEVKYSIDPTKLHAGNNFGRIRIISDGVSFNYEITVVNPGISEKESYFAVKKAKYALVCEYLNFRMKKINAKEWINNTLEYIDKIRANGDNDVFVRLAEAQVFLADGKDTKAKWLIDSCKEEVLLDASKNIPAYCYYLYVNSLYNKDRLGALRVMEKIRDIYDSECDDWRILWMLFYLDDENDKNKSLKLIRLKEQYYKGCTSPVMYLETAAILDEMPMLFRVLDEFEMQVINFASKNGLLSKKTADYVSNMIKSEKNITIPIINVLINLYKAFESDDLLKILCEALIRGGLIDPKYFEWLRLGVEKEFKITMLYEYYIASINTGDMTPLPKPVLMYFMYKNDADYRTKAYVYANVTYNRRQDPKMYESYKKDIEIFAREQLVRGKINENLTIIYSAIFSDSFNVKMTNDENALRNLPGIIFCYKLQCSMMGVSNCIVCHKECNSEVVYPVVNGIAYIQLYTKDALIILETMDGKRYIKNSLYSLTRLLDEDGYLDILQGLYETNPYVALYFSRKYLLAHKAGADVNRIYLAVLKNKEVTLNYKAELSRLLIDYYYDEGEVSDSLATFITLSYNLKLYRRYRVRLVEVMIAAGDFLSAREYIREFNVYPENVKKVIKLATKLITKEGYEEDALINKLTFICFKNARFDERVMTYLIENFNFDTENMVKLYEYSQGYKLDRRDFSERIIAQALFTRAYNRNIYDIFEDYYNHGGRSRISEAYINYNCYNYFVKGIAINENIFRLIRYQIDNGDEVLNVCKLALLYYYSEKEELDAVEKTLAEDLLLYFARRNICFAFYKSFQGRITIPYEIADKTFVEYRTSPDSRVTIHYMYEGDDEKDGYTIEDMNNVFEGIFVKSFVLFYGRSVSYYITEVDSPMEDVIESKTLIGENINARSTEGRYDAINDILAAYDLKDMETMKKLLRSYNVRNYVTNNIFKQM